jgi:hypothetical protein
MIDCLEEVYKKDEWCHSKEGIHCNILSYGKSLLYRVIHKSMKHFKNSQQIDYATDHGNSYAN